MKKKLKLGVLVSHPIQYFVPIYREIAASDDVDFTVLYRCRKGLDEYYDEGFGIELKWDIQLVDGYKHQFLSSKNKIDGFDWGVIGALLRNKFDVLLVHGYNNVTSLLAILVARLIGTKVLMRGDTRQQLHHKHNILKSLFKRIVFKLCNGFVTIGTLNKNYYLQFGVPLDRLFFAPFSVNNQQFIVSKESRADCRQKVRSDLGLSADSLIVLFVSKLIKIKRADDLIQAFANLTEEFPNVHLVIAGSGEDEEKLHSQAELLSIQQIHFLGFQNQTQLPTLYAASDIFVLPSDTESWGLVLNEVMAAGMPVIVSNEVGAAADLVEGKGTGIVYPCGDISALCNSLKILLANSSQRESMASKASELIKQWDTRECVFGILNAALSVAKKK